MTTRSRSAVGYRFSYCRALIDLNRVPLERFLPREYDKGSVNSGACVVRIGFWGT